MDSHKSHRSTVLAAMSRGALSTQAVPARVAGAAQRAVRATSDDLDAPAVWAVHVEEQGPRAAVEAVRQACGLLTLDEGIQVKGLNRMPTMVVSQTVEALVTAGVEASGVQVHLVRLPRRHRDGPSGVGHG